MLKFFSRHYSPTPAHRRHFEKRSLQLQFRKPTLVTRLKSLSLHRTLSSSDSPQTHHHHHYHHHRHRPNHFLNLVKLICSCNHHDDVLYSDADGPMNGIVSNRPHFLRPIPPRHFFFLLALPTIPSPSSNPLLSLPRQFLATPDQPFFHHDNKLPNSLFWSTRRTAHFPVECPYCERRGYTDTHSFLICNTTQFINRLTG